MADLDAQSMRARNFSIGLSRWSLADNHAMPAPSKVVCQRVAPSVAAEVAWLLDLLLQTARYAEPALAELDRSLLPGVRALRSSVKDRFAALWDDSLAGCPELIVAADSSSCLEDPDPRRLLAALSTQPWANGRRRELLSETVPTRRLIRRRLALLDSDIQVRRRYRDLLAEVWRLAGPAWERRGRAVATNVSGEWRRRLSGVTSASEVVRLMAPRHPLVSEDQSAAEKLLRRRRRFVVVPIYFCMSGGLVTDLEDRLLIGVPASSREPARRTRDAAFVADRARILAEPTRVHILMHLLSTASGVMEITRALKVSQPTVSVHVRVLAAAGLVRKERRRNRTVYVASPLKIDRILEDARATLSRWA